MARRHLRAVTSAGHIEALVHPGVGLHLVDLANLAGSGAATADDCAEVLRSYLLVSRWTRADRVVVGASPDLTRRVAWGLPSSFALRCAAPGTAGSEALLSHTRDIDQLARSYGRVVVGSGSNAFSGLAAELRARSVAVEVVALPGALAAHLAQLACRIVALPRPFPSAWRPGDIFTPNAERHSRRDERRSAAHPAPTLTLHEGYDEGHHAAAV